MKLVYIYLLANLLHISLATDVISIHDLKLYVNCKEFIVKGMAYNPVPLGIHNMSSDLTGGGGFCSPKRSPFGEWKSACYDSDYFDGSPDVPDRYPPGPSDGWFQAVWQRDFPILKSLGINTLRLYNANPTTRQASVQQLGTNGIVEAVGKNHIPFMDMAYQNGFKVIFPLVGDQTILTTSSDATIKQLLRNQIDEVGNHSALLMWSFSNELPLATDESLVTLLNKYIPYIRNYTQTKWNRFIPVTAAVVDIPSSYNHLVATLDVDIFSSNAGYRGLNFQDLWTGAATPGFDGFANLSREYNKPLLVSEIGWHQLNNSVTHSIPDWYNQIYKDLVIHIDQGCIGGVFFEYSDEPYSKVDPLQQDMGVVSFTPSTDSTGKSSLLPDVWTPDNAVEKDIIFASLKNGSYQGVAYNFNTDIFTLLGRSQTTLSSCTIPSTTGSPNPSSSTTGSNGSTTGSSNPSSTTGNQNIETFNSGTKMAVSSLALIALFAILL